MAEYAATIVFLAMSGVSALAFLIGYAQGELSARKRPAERIAAGKDGE